MVRCPLLKTLPGYQDNMLIECPYKSRTSHDALYVEELVRLVHDLSCKFGITIGVAKKTADTKRHTV